MIDITKFTGRMGNQMFQYAYVYTQFRDGFIPDVYVQDEKYFAKYKEEIRALFSEGIGYLPYIAIHVRRGDYVDNHFHTDLTKTDYYERAIEHFKDRNFLVFSDDPTWCKENYPFFGNNFQIMEGQTTIEDFNMMASCEGMIIANSSFSWWAAYLNPNHPKIIAPQEKTWFKDGQVRIKLPTNFTQI